MYDAVGEHCNDCLMTMCEKVKGRISIQVTESKLLATVNFISSCRVTKDTSASYILPIQAWENCTHNRHLKLA